MDEINRFPSEEKAHSSCPKGDKKSLKAKSVSNHQLAPLSDDLMPPPPSREELEAPGQVFEAISTIGHALIVNRIRYRESLYIGLGQLALVAECVASKPPLWEQFCRDEQVEPSDETLSFKAHVLRMVIQCAVPSSKKASKYFCAIRTFFEEGMSAEDIPAAIQAGGGIEKLHRKNSKRRGVEKSNKDEVARSIPKIDARFGTEIDPSIFPNMCRLQCEVLFRRRDEKIEISIAKAARIMSTGERRKG